MTHHILEMYYNIKHLFHQIWQMSEIFSNPLYIITVLPSIMSLVGPAKHLLKQSFFQVSFFW